MDKCNAPHVEEDTHATQDCAPCTCVRPNVLRWPGHQVSPAAEGVLRRPYSVRADKPNFDMRLFGLAARLLHMRA